MGKTLANHVQEIEVKLESFGYGGVAESGCEIAAKWLISKVARTPSAEDENSVCWALHGVEQLNVRGMNVTDLHQLNYPTFNTITATN